MPRPLQVYLDSSDFSSLSISSNILPAHAQIQNYLIARQSEGRIQLRFGEPHVLEAAPLDEESISMATARLQIIELLCGKNCLISPSDLLHRETNNYRDGMQAKQVTVLRNDGIWCPEHEQFDSLFLPFENLIEEDLAKLEPSERKRMELNGEYSLLFYKKYIPIFRAFHKNLSTKFPLSKSTIAVLEKYFRGKTKKEDALKAVRSSFTDLDEFARWYAKNWATAVDFSHLLRNIGSYFQDQLKESQLLISGLIQESLAFGESQEKVERTIMSSFNETLGERNDRPNNTATNDNELTNESMKILDPWLTQPGLMTVNTLAMYIARRSITGKSPRKSKRSDFGDIYHAIYLPYVDIFRADAFTASVIKECKLPINSTAVDSFLDLPSKIELALAVQEQ